MPEKLQAETGVHRGRHTAHGASCHKPLREPDVRVLVGQGDVCPRDVAHLLGIEGPPDGDKNLHRQGDSFAMNTVEHVGVMGGELHVLASGAPWSRMGTRKL